jgi:erythronate-4-phosphate dehydrogenase
VKIVADRDIPRAGHLFSTIDELQLLDGRQISTAVVTDADAIIVRSITRVDAQLLQGSKVRFVASATSGTDHVDLQYLHDNAIGFSHAPGCNARSVAEYVLSALFALQHMHGGSLADRRAVVIGCGHIGSLLQKLLNTLGIQCAAYDPPLAASTGEAKYLDMDAVESADIISLHVPLVEDGPYPTRHLVNAGFLDRIRPDAILINTARGAVIDETALLDYIRDNNRLRVVLDVWQDEPFISRNLLAAVTIGTPHIAGYSLDGKLKAAHAVFRGVCDYFNIDYDRAAIGANDSSPGKELIMPPEPDHWTALAHAVRATYDILHDHHLLTGLLDTDAQQGAGFFDGLRKHYRVRREFTATDIKLPAADPALQSKMNALGFAVSSIPGKST